MPEKALYEGVFAFGKIVQLVMENYPKEEINRVIGFFNAAEPSGKLRQLSVPDLSPGIS